MSDESERNNPPGRQGPGGIPGLPPRGFGPGAGDGGGFDDGPGAGRAEPSRGSGGEERVEAESPASGPATVSASESGQPDGNCVLIGPSLAGKTTVLQALDQACSCPSDPNDRFRLEYIGGEMTKDHEELTQLGPRTVTEVGHKIMNTERNKHYEAWITATEERTFWRPERQHIAHLKILDGPGGALFPTEITEKDFSKHMAGFESELIKVGQFAGTLVFCVDAKDPRLALLTRFMSRILANLGRPYQRRPEAPLGYRLLRKLRLAREVPPPAMGRRIEASRVLLLLTKIDQLVSDKPHWSQKAVPGYSPPTPALVAAGLSPLDVACELLGEATLLRILNTLKPEAQFAVGLTSAWGFNPFNGKPFVKDDNPISISTKDPSRNLLNWRPFGIREALLFITTGEARRPMERVKASSLGSRLGAPRFEVPRQFFDAEN